MVLLPFDAGTFGGAETFDAGNFWGGLCHRVGNGKT
jgi:hypothetical protein